MRRLYKGVLALILAILILYPFLPIPGDSSIEEDNRGVLEDIQLAILHYNQSTRLLVRGEAPGSGAAEEALDVASRLEELALLGGDGGLLGIMSTAFTSYAHMARAAAMAYNADIVHDRIEGNISRVIKLLGECKVEEAVSEWRSIKGQVNTLLDVLSLALDNATKVDPDNLLSGDHRDAYTRGLTILQGLYNDLNLLWTIMDMVEENPNAQIECIQGNMSLGLDPSSANIGGSPYSYELYTLLLKLQGGPQEPQEQGQDIGTGIGTGQGAGWGQPPSDD